MSLDENLSARERRLRTHLDAAKNTALDPEILRQVHLQHRSGRPLVMVLELDTDVPLVDLLVNAAVAATTAGVTAVRVTSLKTPKPTRHHDPSE